MFSHKPPDIFSLPNKSLPIFAFKILFWNSKSNLAIKNFHLISLIMLIPSISILPCLIEFLTCPLKRKRSSFQAWISILWIYRKYINKWQYSSHTVISSTLSLRKWNLVSILAPYILSVNLQSWVLVYYPHISLNSCVWSVCFKIFLIHIASQRVDTATIWSTSHVDKDMNICFLRSS